MISKLKKNSRSIERLIHSKRFAAYFSNTTWLFADQVFNLAAAFAVGILVARYLGPAEFGLLNVSKSFGQLSLILCGLGLESIVVRNILNDSDKNRLLGSALGLQLGISLLVTALFALFGGFLAEERILYYLLLLNAGATVFLSFNVISYYFQSQIQSKFVSWVVITKIVVINGLKVALVVYEYPLIYFGGVILLEAAIAAVGLVLVFQRKSGLNLRRWRFDFPYARNLLKDSWPLVFAGFTAFVCNKTDIIMVKYLMGNAEAGQYAVAFNFTSVWFFVGIVLSKSLFPAILNAKNKSEAQYRQRIQQLLRLVVVIGLGISIFVSLVSEYVIDTFYGVDYLPAIGVIRIQVWAIVFTFIGTVATKWYIAENLQIINLNRTSLGAVMNIGLNFLLIPRYGIEGAAAGTVAVHFFASFAGNAISKKTRSLFYMQAKALTLFLK